MDVGESMVKTLQNTKYSIDEKLDNSSIQLFRGTAPVKVDMQDSEIGSDIEDDEEEDEEDGEEEEDDEEDDAEDEEVHTTKKIFQEVDNSDGEGESDDDDEDGGDHSGEL